MLYCCLLEDSSDKESDEEEERDPLPEVTEIRFIPDDVDACEFTGRHLLVTFDCFVLMFQGWKNMIFSKVKKSDFFDLNQIFRFKSVFYFFKFIFLRQGFTRFLKLVCLLNHMLLLFPVILLLSKK